MKGSGKPKELASQATGGVLNFFAAGINAGKGVIRTSADSMAGRRMTQAPGAILAADEERIKQEALKRKEALPNSGCGAREVARRLKQMNKPTKLNPEG